MPVNTRHPLYKISFPLWTKMRDTTAGEEAVKLAGVRYLPMLGGQTQSAYDGYRMRAMFYGATGRTVLAMTGLVHRRPADVQFPVAQQDILKTISQEGSSLEVLMKEVTYENISQGRVGLYVDAAVDSDTPYVALYKATNVINWQTKEINGANMLIRVVLRETYTIYEEGDQFTAIEKEQYREVYLTATQIDEESEVEYLVKVNVWREQEKEEDSDETEWYIAEDYTPTQRGGRPLTAIPFVFVNKANLLPQPSEPPLLDLANVNLSHYRTSADLEHGRHFTALPTPWAAGFDVEEGQALPIGSTKAWIAEDPQAKAGYLEFSGAGLASLDQAEQEKRATMAVLGGRMLERSTTDGQEATETVKIRNAGEQSALRTLADTEGSAWTKVLRIVAEWIGITAEDSLEKVSVTMNTDFNAIPIDNQRITTLMEAVQQGLMSWDVFYWNMDQGEMYPEGHSSETERDLISTQSGTPPNNIPGNEV